MIRTTSLTTKTIADLEQGELFRYSFGASAGLLLLIGGLRNGQRLFGILSSTEFQSPMQWYQGTEIGHCLSYGCDWVLEEVHGPETACGLSYSQQTASLFIDDAGPVFAFSAGARMLGWGKKYFALQSSQILESIGREAAPVNRWRIWESQDHFDRGGDPLFEMPTQPTQQK